MTRHSELAKKRYHNNPEARKKMMAKALNYYYEHQDERKAKMREYYKRSIRGKQEAERIDNFIEEL